MKALIHAEWDDDVKFCLENLCKEIEVEFRDKTREKYLYRDFDNLEDLIGFAKSYEKSNNGYFMLSSAENMHSTHNLGIDKLPLELENVEFGLHLDYMGW